MTVKELIIELLQKPMEAMVYVGIQNHNDNTAIIVYENQYVKNNSDIFVEDDGYDVAEKVNVFVKGLIKTEEY